MMDRRLIVMRHAKSSWSSGAATDHARPLNERGRGDAPRVAVSLIECGWQPEFMLSSDAQRTRETAELMESRWPGPVPSEFLRSFYNGGYEQLVQEAGLIPTDAVTVLVLGHNPGWQEIVLALTGQMVEMKTATAALLAGKGDNWHAALRARRQWQIVDVIYPREI